MQKRTKPNYDEDDGLAAASAMRAELISLLEIADGNAQPVARLLRLLDHVEADLRIGVEGDELFPSESKGAELASRTYHTEERDGGEVLVETWPGKSVDPFRCSRDVYDAIAKVMDTHWKRGMKFRELLKETTSVLGRAPAEHHLRVCLRFWLAQGVLLRNKFQYFSKAKREFAKAAALAWENAPNIVRMKPR